MRRMARRLLAELVRSGFLFILSVLLVLGFYVHSAFYAIGFIPLLVGGSVATFLVITTTRVIVAGQIPGRRPVGEVAFSTDDLERVLLAPSVSTILPVRSDLALNGDVVRAKDEAGREFARLIATDGRRKLLGDVTDDEARMAGFSSAQEVHDVARAEWGLEMEAPIAILTFKKAGNLG